MYKSKLILLLGIIFFVGTAFGRSVIPVVEGDGTLQAAVENSEPGDVLELVTDGGDYPIVDDNRIKIEWPLTIRAAEGLSAKPHIYIAGDDAKCLFQIEDWGRLTLMGLDLDGNGGEAQCAMIARSKAEVGVPNFIAIDCDFHGVEKTGYRSQDVAVADIVRFENCTFYDMQRHGLQFDDWDGEMIDMYNLIVNNCTFYDIDQSVISMEIDSAYAENPDNPIPKVRISNITADSVGIVESDPMVEMPWALDTQIENAIFANGAHPDSTEGFALWGENSSIDYALMYHVGLAEMNAGATLGENIASDDPGFADESSGDFTLDSGSPAIGSGSDGNAMGDLSWDPNFTDPVPTNMVMVEPGDGTLEAAVEESKPGDIIELTASGDYAIVNDKNLDIDHPLTIHAAAGLSTKPHIFIGGPEAKVLFQLNDHSGLILEGLDLDAFGGTVQAQMVARTKSEVGGSSFEAYNCDFHGGSKSGYRSQDAAIAAVVRFENCNFYDFERHALQFDDWDNSVVDMKDLIIRNCTFVGLWQNVISIEYDSAYAANEDNLMTNALIEHITADSIGIVENEAFIHTEWATNTTVKNSIFSNGAPPDSADSFLLYGANSSIDYMLMYHANPGVVESGAAVGVNIVADADPMYTDPDNWDYTLSSGSPALAQADDGHALGDLRWDPDYTAIDQDIADLPANFILQQNYPNPFNPTTTISFEIPAKAHTQLAVYNLLGQQVAILMNRTVPSGQYNVQFDAKDLPSGVYVYQLKSGARNAQGKMVVLK